jgi:hypothetical protein
MEAGFSWRISPTEIRPAATGFGSLTVGVSVLHFPIPQQSPLPSNLARIMHRLSSLRSDKGGFVPQMKAGDTAVDHLCMILAQDRYGLVENLKSKNANPKIPNLKSRNPSF